ncbi:MAG: fumarylacetoacetate hydrolase family protein [Anaerolineae bacterium]|nr:MAG: fumarylacetoacetate hydrolase family protein [Anaerolineae bacterium]
MKLLNFYHNNEIRLGIKTDKGVIDVAAVAQNAPASIDAVLASGLESLKHISASTLLDESQLRYAPCVTNPGKIICIGLNYRRHAEETNAPIPEVPIVFSKFSNALAAAGEDIPLPAKSEKCDYEVELGVVIGKTAYNVRQTQALDYVFGYFTANDLSARDFQLRTSQWLLGKTPDKFMPVGPYLVTADEVGDPQNLFLKCWVNGDLRQDSNTADMIFSVAEIVSYLSQHFTLQPGDVILTGTPSGVILGMKDASWLKPGDEVVVEVEKLGRLSNHMVRDSRA